MTSVRCLIKYSPDTIEVTAGLKDRIEIWRKATDGIGKFKALLLGSWVNQFDPDDPIQIRFNDIIVFEGYIDKGLPLAKGDVYNQFYDLVGRDYGQDLLNKQVNKTGTWMYKVQYADLIIDDMLSKANSEITFTPSGDHKYGTDTPIPQISYTDQGDEYLLEAFRKIFEQINYDFYVDENKALQIFPIGSINSGIHLKCVKDASDNNLLNLQKTEFDTYDLRNYVIAKVEKIDDGWTDGNAADFTKMAYNIVSDDFVDVVKGISSIKCERNTGVEYKLGLEFPKYDYPHLPFDIFQEETIRFAFQYHSTLGGMRGRMHVILTDTDGHEIEYFATGLSNDIWHNLTVPIGKAVHIEPYDNYGVLSLKWHAPVENGWQYRSNTYNTFNWQVTKLIFYMTRLEPGNLWSNTMWIDNLTIPLPMVSYKQDGESQGKYKVRRYVINARNIRTQSELNELAQSELNKQKEPLYSLHVTALGSAGMIGGAFKWIPGYMVTVNSPSDGINDQEYRISEAHCIVSEEGEKGHDFIVEAELVPKELSISGKRLSNVQTPEIALLRELSDRVRYFEKMEAAHFDYLPPMPADAASKIKVGDFFNLSDTVVEFTRRWEAEEVDADEEWAVTEDSAASKGYCRKITSSLYKNIRFVNAPLGCVGEFYIIVRVKIADKTKTAYFFLSVTDKDTSIVLGSMNIYASQFPANDKYHHFALRIELPADKQNLLINLEGRCTTGQIEYCDYCALLPANIPLGYADVTVDNGTQNTSAEDATQNSSAQDATQNSAAQDATQNTSCPAAGAGVVAAKASYYLTASGIPLTTWTDVGAAQTVPNEDVETLVVMGYLRNDSGGCIFRYRLLDETDNIYYPVEIYTSCPKMDSHGIGETITVLVTLPKNVKNHSLKWQIYIETGPSSSSVAMTMNMWGHSPHTHALINPSHSTGMNNPAHATGVNNPAHSTGITNPAHGHGVTDPKHEH